MICVGMDVSKDKHDGFILNSEGVVLADVFTIPNNLEGFNTLLGKLRACSTPQDSIKAGLEATGHYSYNILGFLLDNGLPTYVLNPLRTSLYRKSLSLRKAKTDRVDARTIASMLLSDAGLKPYTDTVYHSEELKSLTRYRFDKVKERGKLKTSVSRLVCILFPELENMVSTLHAASVYALLEEFSGAKQIAATHLTRLKTLLAEASRGRFGRDMAMEIRDAAQSGQLKNRYPHMEKRGSRYLRYALYNAAKYVCHWDPAFADYLAKKRAEGRWSPVETVQRRPNRQVRQHCHVALSHAVKKLVRLICALEKSGQPYCPAP